MTAVIIFVLVVTLLVVAEWTSTPRGGAEIVNFEPSPEFKMPASMGIDYIATEDRTDTPSPDASQTRQPCGIMSPVGSARPKTGAPTQP